MFFFQTTKGAIEFWPIKICVKAPVWCFCSGACRLGLCRKGVDTGELDINLILGFKPSRTVKTTIQM